MRLYHHISLCWLGAATAFAISPTAFQASAADCVLTPPGLVGWWPGDDHFYDLGGTNRGIKINNVSFAAGKVGESISLNGERSGVAVGSPASLQLQSFTYGIQYSADLSQANDWAGLTNLTLSQPVQLWYETQPANQPRRFYRVIPGPIPVP